MRSADDGRFQADGASRGRQTTDDGTEAGIRNLSLLIHTYPVVVIRRLIDRHRAYTGIFLRGEPPRIFPTSDVEHGRILQIYKQDRHYAGIVNDFSEYAIGSDAPLPAAPAAVDERPTP